MINIYSYSSKYLTDDDRTVTNARTDRTPLRTRPPLETVIRLPMPVGHMERYDLVYQLYDEYDTKTLREFQEFVDVFPAVDSRVALEHWQEATEELEERKDEIRSSFAAGETFAEIAARATRDQAFTALDLEAKYGRAVNVLVLDVDETLRSAGGTDNEIPRDTLHMLTEFYDAGVPIVICTGQTLENVKGFAIQGLGSEIVHSGSLSIVYEAGTGVFTPGHGAQTKQLLYEDLEESIRTSSTTFARGSCPKRRRTSAAAVTSRVTSSMSR